MNNIEIFGIPYFKSGIKIKEKNKGSFTRYCNGKVTLECIDKGKNSPNKAIRKKAIFALNSRSWSKKHLNGGLLSSNLRTVWNDVTEHGPTLIKDIVLIVDPTGISSWGDIYTSYNNGDWSEFAFNTLGAIPVLGKVTKIPKAIKLIKNFPYKVLKKYILILPKKWFLPRITAAPDVIYDADNIINGGEISRLGASNWYGDRATTLHGDDGRWNGYFNPANKHLNDKSGKDRNLLRLSLYGDTTGLKKYTGDPIIVNGKLFNDPNKTYVMNLYNNPVLGLSKEDYAKMVGNITKLSTDGYQYAKDLGLNIDLDMIDVGRYGVGIKKEKARFFDKWDFNWLMNPRLFKPTRKYPNAGDFYFVEEVPVKIKNKTDKSFNLIREDE